MPFITLAAEDTPPEVSSRWWSGTSPPAHLILTSSSSDTAAWHWFVVVSASGSVLHMHVFSFFMHYGGRRSQILADSVGVREDEDPWACGGKPPDGIPFFINRQRGWKGRGLSSLPLCPLSVSPFLSSSFIILTLSSSALRFPSLVPSTFRDFLSPQFVFTFEDNSWAWQKNGFSSRPSHTGHN